MEMINKYNSSDNIIVYKSNELIESCYNLTTAQNRLIYLAMTKLETIILEKNLNIKEVENKIKKSDFDLINISVIDYKKTFGIKSNNLYGELSRVADSLFNEEVLYINDKGGLGRKRWVITCEYDPKQKGVDIQFHPSMIKDLLIFKSEYTGMIFDGFATKIKGKYSFRLYELCKQYYKLTKRDFEIEDLRFMLDLRDNEYSEYRDLKRMLKAAIKEINQKTDIWIDFDEIEKEPRTKKVLKVRFLIKDNPNQESNCLSDNTNINSDTMSQVKMISDLVGYKVTAQQAKVIIKTALSTIDSNTEIQDIGVNEFIKEKVDICKGYVKAKGTNNYVGLLLKALENNWTKNIVIQADVIEGIEGNYTGNNSKRLKNNNIDLSRYKDSEEMDEHMYLGNQETFFDEAAIGIED